MAYKTEIAADLANRARAVTRELRAFLNEQREVWEASSDYTGEWHPLTAYGYWLDEVQNAVIALEELEYRFGGSL
jgi:hypothetical protein